MTQRSVRRLAALVAPLIAAVAACSDGATLTWTEDVKLPDGRIVTLDRYVEFKGGSSTFGEPSTESYQRFKFKHPVTGEAVQWENTKTEGRLDTLALWMNQSKAMLLTTPLYGDADFIYKCPNPPYLLYEYSQGQWVRRPLAEVGLEQLKSNMTSHPLEERQRIENKKHHLSADETSNSYTYRDGTQRVPYILTFRALPAQVFDQNCPHRRSPLNYLLLSEGK